VVAVSLANDVPQKATPNPPSSPTYKALRETHASPYSTIFEMNYFGEKN
jgi:hypothetical protein